jgi:hypothetical protein
VSKTTAIVIGCVTAAMAWCFADVLFFDRALAFRDTAYYYFPQFSLIRDEIAQGRLPLWNPYLNTGVPLLATGNSGLFYLPLWLALICPGDVARIWSLFVTAHIALAAWSAYQMTRGFACSRMASGVAALAYAFGGAVLFQYANVIYLIGAAWLPLAILGVERVRNGPRPRDVITLGIVLAMIVFGGDPQLAYHVGIIAVLRLCLPVYTTDTNSATPAGRGRAALGLATACAVALALAAVQWLPSYNFARTSDRAIEMTPLFDSEGPRSAAATGPLTPHAVKRYWFSVGPWRLAELLVPNFSGQMFPRHQRWLAALPAETQPWTASLYMGIVPLLLAGLTWRCARSDPRCRWLWAVAIFAVLAGFGRYGLGWCGEELGFVSPTFADLPEEVRATGGLYWLMSKTLPGYDAFRYPAKWMVVAAAAFAALAAIGWDRLFDPGGAATRQQQLISRGLFACGGIALIAAVVLVVAHRSWPTWGTHVPADPLFGPFDTAAALWRLVTSLLQVAGVALAVGLLVLNRKRLGETAAVAILCVTTVDLALAARPIVATLPLASGVFDVPDDWDETTQRPRRCPGPQPLPTAWRERSSDDRLAEWLAWQQASGHPNWNLLDRTPVGIVSPAVWPYAAKAYFLARIERGNSPSVALGAAPSPRASISSNVVRLATIDETSAEDVNRRTDEVLDLLSVTADTTRLAVVEIDTPIDEWTMLDANVLGGSCQIMAETTDRVEVAAELSRPGVLVLADLYTPEWRAMIATDGNVVAADVLRVNRIMRGVVLPAGEHRVTLTYRPASFTIGAATSGLAWSILTVIAAVSLWRRRGAVS